MVTIIAKQDQAANPLFLKALLEELRIFGKHEELDARIAFYLNAQDTEELYQLILTRLEDDCGSEMSHAVKETLTLIWAARKGITENEIFEISNINQLEWAPIYLALQNSLVNRSGRLTFFHRYLQQAVYDKYICNEDEAIKLHKKIAEHFSEKPLNIRKAEELPWQLIKSYEWKKLNECLSDLDFLSFAYKWNKSDIYQFWQLLEEKSLFGKSESYQFVFLNPKQYIKDLWILSDLFSTAGARIESRMLMRTLVDYYKSIDDFKNLRICLGILAQDENALGNTEKAAELIELQKNLLDKEGGIDLNNLLLRTSMMLDKGEYNKAKKELKTAEQYCRESANNFFLCECLVRLLRIHHMQDDLDQYKNVYNELVSLAKLLGDIETLNICKGIEAERKTKTGDFEGASQIYHELTEYYSKIGNKKNLQSAYGNRAILLIELRNYDEALTLLKKQEELCLEMIFKKGLADCYGNMGLVYHHTGNLLEAYECYRKQERICLELGMLYGLQNSYGNQALIMQEGYQFERAKALYLKKIEICRKIGKKDELVKGLINYANFLYEFQKDLQDADNARREASEIINNIDHNIART